MRFFSTYNSWGSSAFSMEHQVRHLRVDKATFKPWQKRERTSFLLLVTIRIDQPAKLSNYLWCPVHSSPPWNFARALQVMPTTRRNIVCWLVAHAWMSPFLLIMKSVLDSNLAGTRTIELYLLSTGHPPLFKPPPADHCPPFMIPSSWLGHSGPVPGWLYPAFHFMSLTHQSDDSMLRQVNKLTIYI